MKRDFQNEVESIIKYVHQAMKKGGVVGASPYTDEGALLQVANRIDDLQRAKAATGIGLGIKGSPKDESEVPTQEVLRWAAARYFKILFVDLRDFGEFQDHEHLKPSGE